MTHRLQHILLLAALLAVAAACAKQDPASGRGPYTESVVHISAIIDDASAATKSTHAFDARYNPNYGILTCVHGTYDRFGERWYNVRANRRTATSGSDPDTYYYPQGWGYNYTLSDGTPETGTTDGSNEFILVERDMGPGSGAVDQRQSEVLASLAYSFHHREKRCYAASSGYCQDMIPVTYIVMGEVT